MTHGRSRAEAGTSLGRNRNIPTPFKPASSPLPRFRRWQVWAPGPDPAPAMGARGALARMGRRSGAALRRRHPLAAAAILVFRTPEMAAARGRRRRSGVRMRGRHNKDGGGSDRTAAESGSGVAAHTGQRVPSPHGRRWIRARGPHLPAPEPR